MVLIKTNLLFYLLNENNNVKHNEKIGLNCPDKDKVVLYYEVFVDVHSNTYKR